MSVLTLIYGNKNYSSWSLRPWLWLKQCEIDFTEKQISLVGANLKKELAGYFSDMKVPLLLDQGEQIWDSLAILEYLGEVYPKCAWPQDRTARAVARSVSAEMHSSFHALRGAMPMNCSKQFVGFPIADDVLRDIERIDAIWSDCRQRFGEKGPWLFGEFSIADAMYAPVVVRFWGFQVYLSEVANSYMQTVLSNPHLQQWMTEGRRENEILDFDEIDASFCEKVIEVKA